MLGNIKIERSKDGWIALTATDLDHHVTVRLEQPGEGEPAALLVPDDGLLKTCKAGGSGEEILVERTGNNTATIKYRIGAQFVETKVESLPVAEFPDIPRIKGDAIALPDTLRRAIHEALQCASTDETRVIINGAYIDVSDPKCQHVVGTNGCHLFSSNSFSLPLAQSLLIPGHRFLGYGQWQLKVVTAEHKDNAPVFQLSSRRWRYIGRQIGGNYPNWRQVVPEAKSYTTTIEFVAEVAGVLQTIGRMPCDDAVNNAIGLELKSGQLTMLGRSPGAESYTRIALENVKAEGRDVKIFLNREFLAKALEFGLTHVETIDALSPLRFSNGGRQMIVMPTRPQRRAGAATATARARSDPRRARSRPRASHRPYRCWRSKKLSNPPKENPCPKRSRPPRSRRPRHRPSIRPSRRSKSSGAICATPSPVSTNSPRRSSKPSERARPARKNAPRARLLEQSRSALGMSPV